MVGVLALKAEVCGAAVALGQVVDLDLGDGLPGRVQRR